MRALFEDENTPDLVKFGRRAYPFGADIRLKYTFAIRATYGHVYRALAGPIDLVQSSGQFSKWLKFLEKVKLLRLKKIGHLLRSGGLAPGKRDDS